MGDGKLRALVATASLDLGIDWGNVDLVCQMGAPKGSSRLLQRIGRANHRLDEPSKGMIVPGNRFEYLEAQAALDAVDARELDPEIFRPGTLDVLAQHILAIACAGPFVEAELLAEVRSAAPYAGLTDTVWRTVLEYIATGGYALRAYDKFRRLVEDSARPLAHHQARGNRPAPPQRRDHRRQSDDGRPLQERPNARQGRGRLRLDPDARRPHLLRRAEPRDRAVQGQRHHRAAPRPSRRGSLPTAASACRCRPTSPNASATISPAPTNGRVFPTTCANGSKSSSAARACRSPTNCWSKPFRSKAAITW